MSQKSDERFPTEGDPEKARRDRLKIDPDSVAPDPDERDKPKPADAPLKDQGDPLSE